MAPKNDHKRLEESQFRKKPDEGHVGTGNVGAEECDASSNGDFQTNQGMGRNSSPSAQSERIVPICSNRSETTANNLMVSIPYKSHEQSVGDLLSTGYNRPSVIPHSDGNFGSSNFNEIRKRRTWINLEEKEKEKDKKKEKVNNRKRTTSHVGSTDSKALAWQAFRGKWKKPRGTEHEGKTDAANKEKTDAKNEDIGTFEQLGVANLANFEIMNRSGVNAVYLTRCCVCHKDLQNSMIHEVRHMTCHSFHKDCADQYNTPADSCPRCI